MRSGHDGIRTKPCWDKTPAPNWTHQDLPGGRLLLLRPTHQLTDLHGATIVTTTYWHKEVLFCKPSFASLSRTGAFSALNEALCTGAHSSYYLLENTQVNLEYAVRHQGAHPFSFIYWRAVFVSSTALLLITRTVKIRIDLLTAIVYCRGSSLPVQSG